MIALALLLGALLGAFACWWWLQPRPLPSSGFAAPRSGTAVLVNTAGDVVSTRKIHGETRYIMRPHGREPMETFVFDQTVNGEHIFRVKR